MYEKGTLRFRENVNDKCASFIQFVFSSIIVMW